MCDLFGYVRIFKPQLRICEYDAYKAVYCTLCKHLGRQYGPQARLLLTYDYTFVAMLYMALHKQAVNPKKSVCVCNPLKKCIYCTCDKSAFDLTCAMTAEMFYYKTVDNIQDSGFFGRMGWRAVKLLAAPMRKKSMRLYPEMEEIMAQCSKAQYAAEHEGSGSVDESAEPTAKMLSDLAQLLSEDETEKRVLKDFGYYLGRWIYLIDAFDDIEKDIRADSFNPFVKRFELTIKDIEEDSELLEQARLYANETLNMTVARAAKAFELLNLGDYAPIFNNIIYLGLGEAQRRALHEKELQEK